MYKKHDIEFTIYELNRFNLIESDGIRLSLMSIYRYLLKLNLKRNTQLKEVNLENLKEDPYKLNMSFRKFLAAYNRRGSSYSKISIGTLKQRIDKLVELNLIHTSKIKKSFTYSFCRYEMNTNLNNSNNTESVDTTSLDVDLKNYKSISFLNPKGFKKDLDSNKIDNFDYENYLNQNEKCTWEDVSSVLPKLFKLLKIKSHWIKGQVISKLFNYARFITKKHMVKYICSAIINARSDYYRNYCKFIINSNTEEQSTWRTKNQRQYDFDKLEKGLLGLL